MSLTGENNVFEARVLPPPTDLTDKSCRSHYIPCWSFNSSRGYTRGNACRFSHGRPPCLYFNTNIGCLKGHGCPFPHIIVTNPSQPVQPGLSGSLDHWHSEQANEFAARRQRSKDWIQTVYTVVTGRQQSTSSCESIITNLSSGNGLYFIDQMLTYTPRFGSDLNIVSEWYHDLVMPLLKTISSTAVTLSTRLTEPLNRIHKHLYRQDCHGEWGTILFTSLACCLDDFLPEPPRIVDDMRAILLVLRRILDLQGGAILKQTLEWYAIQVFRRILGRQGIRAAECRLVMQDILMMLAGA